jgi:hypothetical protein
MKKKILGVLISVLLLSACAGKTPNPIPQHQPGDESLSCSALKQELMDNQTKITNLIPKQNKTGKNVGLGIAGAFLIVPWFFMDFSDAERIEIQSYQLRDNWLRTLSAQKKCSALPPAIKFQGQ